MKASEGQDWIYLDRIRQRSLLITYNVYVYAQVQIDGLDGEDWIYPDRIRQRSAVISDRNAVTPGMLVIARGTHCRDESPFLDFFSDLSTYEKGPDQLQNLSFLGLILVIRAILECVHFSGSNYQKFVDM